MPKAAWPVHLGAVSRRASGLPARVKLSGGLMAGSWSSPIAAASAASVPKLRRSPPAPCWTKPSAALHSAGATCQRLAAAAISRARALAPTCCSISWEPRTERLPPVPRLP